MHLIPIHVFTGKAKFLHDAVEVMDIMSRSVIERVSSSESEGGVGDPLETYMLQVSCGEEGFNMI